MKIKRTENAKKGIMFGTFSNVLNILAPFLLRTVLLYTLGVQYLGLNSLFSSVLQFLNLAELGVGSAMVYSMYKPIAEDDSEKICALMKLYRTYYRIIGGVVLCVGIVITPFLPYLISGDIPEGVSIYVLYFMDLAATVLSYWLFAYKNCLLDAFQRRDVISKVALATNSCRYIIQLIVLITLKNYYIYILVRLVVTALNNILVSLVVNRMYPQYKPRNNLPKDEVKAINKKVKDLFTQKIGNVINTSSDTIIISAFLGLTLLAMYQNYYYVISLPVALCNVMFDSSKAGIGNSLELDSKEKIYNDFKKISFLINRVICVCSCGLICLYQPFMAMWTGDDLMFPFSIVVLFVVYFFLLINSKLFDMFKDASGIWHQDRLRPLLAALLNLGLNIIMVQFIGIYGILLSSIISYVCLSIPWELHNLFSVVFHRSVVKYLLSICGNVLVTIITCVVAYFICMLLPESGFVWFIIKGFIALFVSCGIQLLVYFSTNDFKQSLELLKRMIKR